MFAGTSTNPVVTLSTGTPEPTGAPVLLGAGVTTVKSTFAKLTEFGTPFNVSFVNTEVELCPAAKVAKGKTGVPLITASIILLTTICKVASEQACGASGATSQTV